MPGTLLSTMVGDSTKIKDTFPALTDFIDWILFYFEEIHKKKITIVQ